MARRVCRSPCHKELSQQAGLCTLHSRTPEHIGKVEYAGLPVAMDSCKLTAYWYLTPEYESDTDSFDWENNVEFEVELTF